MQRFSSRFLSNDAVCLWKYGLSALGGGAVAIGLTLANASSAVAQAAYGSYIGIGPAFGLTQGGAGEPSQVAGNLAVRYKFLRAPLSLRTQVLIGDNVAIVPTVSYDIPLNWQADAYIGAGASIIPSRGSITPLGNQTAFVLQPGIDYALPNSSFVLFGNAIIAFDAYRSGNNTTAISLQGGVGLRF